jgi:hypothetical protein
MLSRSTWVLGGIGLGLLLGGVSLLFYRLVPTGVNGRAAPDLIAVRPSQVELQVEPGALLPFAIDVAPESKLTYSWKLDGQLASTGKRFDLKADDEGGLHVVEVVAREGNEEVTRRRWAVKVISAGAPPSKLAAIDRFLESLDLGNVAFNAPRSLYLGEAAVIQLFLSTKDSIAQLQERITAAGEREGAKIRVSDQMEAHLSAPGFKVEAVTPEIQAVSGAEATEWKWDIESAAPGMQRLHLSLSALVTAEGETRPRVFRTFERTIEVRVAWRARLSALIGEHWKWGWTALLLPAAGWFARQRSQRRTARRRR